MFKKVVVTLIFLLTLSFSVTLFGNESAQKYFPDTLGSYWVYEDQDGNELTRRAVESEEIDGKTYQAFSYDPELKDWTDYIDFVHPSLYQVSEDGVTLFVGEEIEKAVKTRLQKEMDSFTEAIKAQTSEDEESFDLVIDIEVEAEDNLNLIPFPISVNEEWDVNQVKVKIKIIPIGIEDPDPAEITFNFVINGTGIVQGTETVETPAGTFEDCLKVEYQTETTVSTIPEDVSEGMDSPGETVTTVWFAPNIGIVKLHQKKQYIFLEILPENEGFPMPPDPKPITLELKKYEIKSSNTESSKDNSIPAGKLAKDEIEKEKPPTNKAQNPNYFPSTLDSFWVYEDQDGNELTRRAVEGEEIAGKTLSAFSYDPELEDWAEYSPFIRPSLYQVSDAGITLVVGDEVEKAVKARLSKEMELLRGIIELDDPDAANFTFKIEAEAQDHIHLLSTPVTLNEEWDANQIKVSFKLFFEGTERISIDYTILETGIISGIETVETAAGTFEDCLKVEYRTETKVIMGPEPPPPGEVNPPGETATTVWYAPNVGIVKFHHKSGHLFLDLLPDDPDLLIPPAPKPITLELKKYEIKTADFENVEKKSITTTQPPKDETEKEKPPTDKAPTLNYFPGTLDSFWVYEDQDGNELTRRAVEGEEIAGKTLSAFSYDPALEDLTKYSPFIRPSLFNVSNAGITLVVGDEVEKAFKARLKKEIDTFVQLAKIDDPDYDLDVEIKVDAQDHLLFLPNVIAVNEEWDANQIEAEVKLINIDNGVPDEQFIIDFTIIETGIVLGAETVKTPAGTFEDCLKVKYQTESTVEVNPHEEVDPPGETETTVWFAPNVGIVKFHQIRKYTFLELIPENEGFPMPPDPKPITLELKNYKIKTADLESAEKKSITTTKPPTDKTEKEKPPTNKAQNPNYFPSTLDSFWVYEDQDGNELTRRAVEGEEIAGKTFSAFSYEPALEDWTDYSCFIRPSLYQVSDAGITLVVREEIGKALQARLKKEIDIFATILKDEASEDVPEDVHIDVDIEVKGQDLSFLLPDAVTINEEWDVNQIEANAKLAFRGGDLPEDQGLVILVIDFTITETGIISGTETVETPAGKFEDCLKVEYRTETTAALTPAPPPDEVDPPGETVTTVWYAPNVGIVKFRQETNYIFLEMLPDDEDLPVPPGPKTKTFELKKFEIKTADLESAEKKSITTTQPPTDKTEIEKPPTDKAPTLNYFPGTLDSFWVYQNQDGKELTRRAIEDKMIVGKTFPAFSYEPELEDWADYSLFIQSSLYQVNEAGITLVIGDEVEKAVKARLKKEIDTFIQLMRTEETDYNLDVKIKVKAQDNFLFLPDAIAVNEEWDANQIEINVKVADIVDGVPDEDQNHLDFTIVETGIVLGTETIDTAAGTFEDCLKVRYRTETTAVFNPSEEADPPGETETTLWFAPNIGIVQLHQIRRYTFLELVPENAGLPMPPDPKPITLELKKYEIKSAVAESEESN